ncbi:hypothetical protein F4820DRAFT_220647 [Hypoxylon rubiginosum]|uniref:Uncharacterized protein n=1 Tax=Hypoxylon rubiginosum TaxID=110542 RepID=A0ACB9ZG88_9PEZI|nr:hypothetical protein F4820DRAFT_220647 [Hypoxylon rubiginosum]
MSLAPAVSKDGFSYAGDLFAEASGHNRHRRATLAELKDHFKSGSEKDHPAHWFEAQLIHYGLQPSKTKAVARMRLYDAVNGGKLSIPAHIKKLESELKKDWTKNERDAKKALKGGTDSPAVKSTKRKAESENVDLTVNVGGINITVSASNSSKRAKTTAKPATPAKAAKKTPNPKPKTPKTVAAAPKATPVTKPKPKPKPKAATEPRVKTEPSAPFSYGSAAATPTRPIQTARRGRGWTPGGPPRSSYSHPSDDDNNNNSPRRPFYKVEDSDDVFGSGYGNGSSSSGGEELKPLGLLNGRYSITIDDVAEAWGYHDSSLVLTLSGSELWGRFDLHAVHGVLRIPRRPYQSSRSPVAFTWRGREHEYGDGHEGWIRFLGDGVVEGYIDFTGGFRFEGRRLPGQGTRSEADARDLRDEWDGYGERENSARW